MSKPNTEKKIDSVKNNAEMMYNKYLDIIQKEIGNTTTNSLQLTILGRQLFGKKYLGTFASDKIPKMKPETYAIVNLDKSYETGSHWIALIKTNKDTIIYDSFGRSVYKILPIITNEKKKFNVIKETENDPEQKEYETNCGQRCLAAILVYCILGYDALLCI